MYVLYNPAFTGEQIVKQVEQEIAKVVGEGVGPAELERTRTYLRSSRIQQLQSSHSRAALLGRIDTAGTGARTLVTSLITGSDPLAQQAAIARVPRTFTADAVAPVCALLPKVPEGSQIELIAALSGYPGDRVVPAFLGAARSSSDAVRIAALNAIGRTGGPGQVTFLAERASTARGAEQAAARLALGSLKGAPADAEILAQFAKKPADPVAGELLLAIGDRYEKEIAAAKEADAKYR
jgi:hypothetical protein